MTYAHLIINRSLQLLVPTLHSPCRCLHVRLDTVCRTIDIADSKKYKINDNFERTNHFPLFVHEGGQIPEDIIDAHDISLK